MTPARPSCGPRPDAPKPERCVHGNRAPLYCGRYSCLEAVDPPLVAEEHQSSAWIVCRLFELAVGLALVGALAWVIYTWSVP